MERLFISDLHLSDAAPELTHCFERFLELHTQDINELYILGDFFEVWIGDDDATTLTERVRESLKRLTERGIRVYFMPGNRDFLLGTAYLNTIPATLLQDPYPIDIAGESALLMHGDSLCIDDVEYQAFRTQVRDPVWQNELLQKPLDERRTLAQQLRDMSKEANEVKAADIMDVNEQEVDRVMHEHGVSVLIHGHTHRPARHPLSDLRERIVLGDWQADGPVWVCRTGAAGIEFLSLPLPH